MQKVVERLKKMLKKQKKAQTFIEYVIILTIVTAVIYAMMPMIKRGTQSMVMLVADRIGTQVDSEQSRRSEEDAYLVDSTTITTTANNKTRNENMGTITYTYNDSVRNQTTSHSDLGTYEP